MKCSLGLNLKHFFKVGKVFILICTNKATWTNRSLKTICNPATVTMISLVAMFASMGIYSVNHSPYWKVAVWVFMYIFLIASN